MVPSPQSALTELVCPECDRLLDADALQTFCEACASPLMAAYDLAGLRKTLRPEHVAGRPQGTWRWAELLPVRQQAHRLTLGEGDTPLLRAPRLAERLGLENLYLKDEGCNPTGSFKARGMALAVSRAVELGVEAFVVPTAGNAGGALAAYAARAGRPAHVFMPADAPRVNQFEVCAHGAELHLVDGLITDAGRKAAAAAAEHGYFNVSTFKEPYRVEGKKVMGLELAESFAWELPDVIVYPTGGGTGLVGMWKAFHELQALGWLGERLPRIVTVQSAGCAPIVRAFKQGDERAAAWENAETIASGLRVPTAFADRLILRTLRESGGTAVAVPDEEILEHQGQMARLEGVFAAPEGAATLAGLAHLVESGWVRPEERVVLFNTGHGLKYI